MVADWHTAYSALTEVLYIDKETGKLVSRLSRSELAQYHDIICALEERRELEHLVYKFAPRAREIMDALEKNKKLLLQLKKRLIYLEHKSRQLQEISQKDILFVSKMLEGFPLKFSKLSALEKKKAVEKKLIETELREDIIKQRDVEDLLAEDIIKINSELQKLKGVQNYDWLINQFKSLVKALATIRKYEIWHIEFIQPIAGFTEEELAELKKLRA